MEPNYLRYEQTYTQKCNVILCILIDIFVTPLILFGVWNTTIPSLLGADKISYLHALLWKFVLELYLCSPCSKGYCHILNNEELLHYYTMVYTRIHKMGNVLDNVGNNYLNEFKNNMSIFTIKHDNYNTHNNNNNNIDNV